jgi:hypothetical protein
MYYSLHHHLQQTMNTIIYEVCSTTLLFHFVVMYCIDEEVSEPLRWVIIKILCSVINFQISPHQLESLISSESTTTSQYHLHHQHLPSLSSTCIINTCHHLHQRHLPSPSITCTINTCHHLHQRHLPSFSITCTINTCHQLHELHLPSLSITCIIDY